CFLRYEALPTDVLTGSLAALGFPVPVSVALPPPEDRSFADVWTALGGELKPSLDVVVTAPVEAGLSLPAGPPVEKPTVLGAGGIDGSVPQETVGRRPVRVLAQTDDSAAKTQVPVRRRQRKK